MQEDVLTPTHAMSQLKLIPPGRVVQVWSWGCICGRGSSAGPGRTRCPTPWSWPCSWSSCYGDCIEGILMVTMVNGDWKLGLGEISYYNYITRLTKWWNRHLCCCAFTTFGWVLSQFWNLANFGLFFHEHGQQLKFHSPPEGVLK